MEWMNQGLPPGQVPAKVPNRNRVREPNQVQAEFRRENRTELRGKLRRELVSELRAEQREELVAVQRPQLRLELRRELPRELLTELPDEVPDELREELPGELCGMLCSTRVTSFQLPVSSTNGGRRLVDGGLRAPAVQEKRRGPGRDARAVVIVGRLFGGDGDLLHDYGFDRLVHRAGLNLFEFVEHVHAFFELADDRVLAVKLGRGCEADVELAAG
jgi:hypothetical protein